VHMPIGGSAPALYYPPAKKLSRAQRGHLHLAIHLVRLGEPGKMSSRRVMWIQVSMRVRDEDEDEGTDEKISTFPPWIVNPTLQFSAK
jgi:hypothetical protein